MSSERDVRTINGENYNQPENPNNCTQFVRYPNGIFANHYKPGTNLHGDWNVMNMENNKPEILEPDIHHYGKS